MTASSWIRAVGLLLILFTGVLSAVEPVATAPAPPAATPSIDDLVSVFNPDLYALEADGKTPATRISNMFTSPASDIARAVQQNTWFNIAVFMPFLILPQILLLVVIFKFRDRKGDERKPATFVGHHLLEIVWTAIPCLALLVVSFPVWQVLWKMELPPASARDTLNIEVRGKSFAWDYKYQDAGVSIGQDVAGQQEPLVLAKGRTTVLSITSNDVNHAWWVPAFGVKKDAIIGRYTNTWFTPDTEGFFKGQCAELCGQGHGIMIISAVVTTPERFADYLAVQRHRADTLKVWNLLQPSADAVTPVALDAAVTTYLAKGQNSERARALRYWIASNYASVARQHQAKLTPAQVKELALQRRAQLDAALARVAPALAVADTAPTNLN